MAESLFTVGKIVNTHGIRGEIKVISQTDFPDVRFADGSSLLIIHPNLQAPVKIEIEQAREHKGTYILKLKGFNNINEVEKYKGGQLKITDEQLVDLPEDEYYFYEIVGCTVVTDEGKTLGTISEILQPGANDVWVVERPQGKPVLIPVIDDVLLNVDIENKLVKIHLLEGLI
jgi:16S rRNA processing protein RimM